MHFERDSVLYNPQTNKMKLYGNWKIENVLKVAH